MKYHCASALDFYLGFYFSNEKIWVGQLIKCALEKGNNFKKDANFAVLKKIKVTKKYFFLFIPNIL